MTNPFLGSFGPNVFVLSAPMTPRQRWLLMHFETLPRWRIWLERLKWWAQDNVVEPARESWEASG